MATKQQNPFADFFSTENPFAEAFNWDSCVSAGRANAKAFSDAAKAATEGAQAFSRRSAEIAQKQAEKAFECFKEVSSSANNNPQAAFAKQAAYAKKLFEEANKYAAELADIAEKANSDARTILNKRICELLDEASSCSASSCSGNKNDSKKAA